MHNLVDLHLHSLFSDGILTPTELVAEAASLGLRAIALADHDNVDGIPAYDGSTPSGDGEIGTFNAVDETWVLIWTGTEWTTLRATCTFV